MLTENKERFFSHDGAYKTIGKRNKGIDKDAERGFRLLTLQSNIYIVSKIFKVENILC
jgi:hypothetical protein